MQSTDVPPAAYRQGRSDHLYVQIVDQSVFSTHSGRMPQSTVPTSYLTLPGFAQLAKQPFPNREDCFCLFRSYVSVKFSDDVVVCSLHPSNDYKTSVLSGLTPSIILEICSRFVANSPPKYHRHTYFEFQRDLILAVPNSPRKAVVRNVNDKNAQLQKQLENVIREANGEINLLSNKNTELERDLELERRKVRDLQDAARERVKEYQKLKTQHDKIKRKALLASNATGVSSGEDPHTNKLRAFSNPVDLGAVRTKVHPQIQRTPLVNRTSGGSFAPPSHNNNWIQQHPQHQLQHQQQQQQQQQRVQPSARRTQSHRQPFAAQSERERAYQSGNTSDRSGKWTHCCESRMVDGAYTPNASGTSRRISLLFFSPLKQINNNACPADSDPQVSLEAN
ncbi:hypothetical protein C8F04DRAFT_1247276 [Mycena alexandri]|uniref:Uncharacterized protein n=1 Tax=Mycena alexandri TaxID=1745969 RepID=A0AAD6XCS6_9AGAR|nr:hypothetical protein C8F04DRAFT_1247276 [Mycena alexandri]